MAATAGYSTVVQYSADDVSYASISGIKSASGPFNADELEPLQQGGLAGGA